MQNIETFIEAVRSQLQPPARGSATAATLTQLVALVPEGVTLADLNAGWQALSEAKSYLPQVAQRRATCGELAAIAAQFTEEQQGNFDQTVRAWRSWYEAFKDSDDPRQAAMAKTFDREIEELGALL